MSISSSVDGSTPAITDATTETDNDTIEDSIQQVLGSSAANKAWKADGPASQHDLMSKYFRKDVLGLYNVDFLRYGYSLANESVMTYQRASRRVSDVQLVLLVTYSIVSIVLPADLSHSTQLTLHFMHALFWRIVHSFGLGLLLKKQSENKWMVRHFMKHYYYAQVEGAVEEAFANWKGLYNASLCMTYGEHSLLLWLFPS